MNLQYLMAFLKDKNVAELGPTSKFVVKKLCSKINFSKDNIIVEYGPGSGVFSKFILKNMSPNSKLILIETNDNFVNILKQIDDSRIILLNDSAENIKEILKKYEISADYVISGIPFSLFKNDLKIKIVSHTFDSLNPNGKFLIYQYSAHVKPYLQKYFRDINVKIEAMSFPPMFILEAIKN